MLNNVCYFIPHHKDYYSIHTVNFVLETKPQPLMTLKSYGLYKVISFNPAQENCTSPAR